MVGSLLAKLLFLVALLILAHCAHANIEYRHFLALSGEENIVSQWETTLELLVGLGLCVLAVVASTDPFQEIKASRLYENHSIDSALAQVPFYTFAHRGRAFANPDKH
eukprot:c1174_g1_i1.p3 GENE.c1174_g1_i1~~c1174_g1_i1.p3  ORF type:complete len:108 (-),score=17.94 c1174_g1_i1:70-393(-)